MVRFNTVLDELLEVSHSFQLEVCLLGQSAKENDRLFRGIEEDKQQTTTHFAALFSACSGAPWLEDYERSLSQLFFRCNFQQLDHSHQLGESNFATF